MLFKLFTILFLSLACQSAAGIVDNPAPWEILNNVALNAKNAAISSFSNLTNQITSEASKILKTTTADIKKTAEQLILPLNDIKAKSAQTGINNSDCTKENEEELRNVPKFAVNELVSCVTDKINEAVNIVNNAIQSVNNTYENVVKRGSQMSNCGFGLDQVICTGKLAAEMSVDIVKLPVEIFAYVEQIVKLLGNLQRNLELCATSKVAIVAGKGGLILAKATKCIADKALGLTNFSRT